LAGGLTFYTTWYARLAIDPIWEPEGEPLRAFPSWFLRVECDRCGKPVMVNESHARWRDRTLAEILTLMRHDGCGGRPERVELLTGIEGAFSSARLVARR
jgi:hypothetical protein